jgi:hypothetical protein
MASTVSFRKPAGAVPAAAAQQPAPAPQAPVAQQPAPQPAPVAQAPAPAPQPAPVAQTPAPTSTALATQGSAELADTEDKYAGIGGFVGEWNSRHMATPYLSIVGKTSKAFDAHPDWLGQWLYDKEYPLGNELRVVFLTSTLWFVEDLPFGTEKIPQRFARMGDARAAGFNESTIKEQAELDLLIEVDAEDEGAADLAHIIEGNKGYVLARYTVQSTAFGKTASILAKDMSGFLRGCLFGGFYTMTTQQKTSPKGTYFIPVLKTDGKTPDSLKAQIAERLTLASKKAA